MTQQIPFLVIIPREIRTNTCAVKDPNRMFLTVLFLTTRLGTAERPAAGPQPGDGPPRKRAPHTEPRLRSIPNASCGTREAGRRSGPLHARAEGLHTQPHSAPPHPQDPSDPGDPTWLHTTTAVFILTLLTLFLASQGHI